SGGCDDDGGGAMMMMMTVVSWRWRVAASGVVDLIDRRCYTLASNKNFETQTSFLRRSTRLDGFRAAIMVSSNTQSGQRALMNMYKDDAGKAHENLLIIGAHGV
ncbi:hypothetical protein Tco_1476115, partial [Tanacetum coccineum]